jgi:hypothetical protein
MGCRPDLAVGASPVPGLLDLIRFPQRRCVTAPCLVDPLVMALETDRLSAADAVNEFVEIMIAGRTAGLPAMTLVTAVGVILAAGTMIGAAAMITMATAVAIPAAAATAITAATAIAAATTVLGESCLPAKRGPSRPSARARGR